SSVVRQAPAIPVRYSVAKPAVGYTRECWVVPLLWIAAFETALAQAPDPGNYSAARYEIQERRGVMVPMRDGVRLSVDIYSPKSPDRMASLLTITPYDNTAWRTDARWFATRGYVVAAADSRGRYDSEGTWDPFDARHKVDGYDLVEWMARQP